MLICELSSKQKNTMKIDKSVIYIYNIETLWIVLIRCIYFLGVTFRLSGHFPISHWLKVVKLNFLAPEKWEFYLLLLFICLKYNHNYLIACNTHVLFTLRIFVRFVYFQSPKQNFERGRETIEFTRKRISLIFKRILCCVVKRWLLSVSLLSGRLRNRP